MGAGDLGRLGGDPARPEVVRDDFPAVGERLEEAIAEEHRRPTGTDRRREVVVVLGGERRAGGAGDEAVVPECGRVRPHDLRAGHRTVGEPAVGPTLTLVRDVVVLLDEGNDRLHPVSYTHLTLPTKRIV